MSSGRRHFAAVILDAAGTLIEVAEPVGSTYARVAARHRIVLEAGEVEQRFRRALETAPPLAFPGADAGTLPALEKGWWRAVAGNAFGAARKHAAFEACFDELFAYYASANAWRVFPDAEPALGALRSRGLRLAVVSNFDRRLVGLLGELGLAAFFDRILPSAAAGAAKPDAAIFHRAIAALGVVPPAALHVGDRLREDVEGAAAAGLVAVLLDRAGQRPSLPPGVRALASLADLPALVDTST